MDLWILLEPHITLTHTHEAGYNPWLTPSTHSLLGEQRNGWRETAHLSPFSLSCDPSAITTALCRSMTVKFTMIWPCSRLATGSQYLLWMNLELTSERSLDMVATSRRSKPGRWDITPDWHSVHIHWWVDTGQWAGIQGECPSISTLPGNWTCELLVMRQVCQPLHHGVCLYVLPEPKPPHQRRMNWPYDYLNSSINWILSLLR